MSLFFVSMPIVAVHVFYYSLQRFLLKWRKISQELGAGVGRLSPRTTPKSARAGGIQNSAVSNIVFGTKNFNPQNTQS